MTVLLIGPDIGHEFDLLRTELRRRDADVITADLDDWPGREPLTHDATESTVRIGAETIPLEAIEGAFVRVNSLFVPAARGKTTTPLNEAVNPYAVVTQLREYRGLVKSVIRSLDARGSTVVPTADAFDWEEVKPYMYERFHAAGVPTPETVSTVDPETAKRFVRDHGRVVYKPIAGVGGASVMTADDLERLDGLTTPVLFQEFVPGDDVRAYVVDGACRGAFTYGYDGDAFSFKQTPQDDVSAERVTLPDEARDDVRRAAALGPNNYTAVDLRLRDDGSYAILEANPGGRFMLPDSSGITEVAGAIAEFLVD